MKRLIAIALAAACMIACPAPAAAQGSIKHVILFMEENHSYSQALSGMPWLKSQAQKFAYASHYSAITHPSLPNYLALTSGSTQGKDGSDCSPSPSCEFSSNNIFNQLQSNWRVWAESEPSHCAKSDAGEYAVRHTAAPYYTDLASTCKTNDVSYPTNPGWSTAKFVLAVPNLLHDAHDGSLAQADSWLKAKVTQLMSNAAYQDGSTLIEVTFDEGSGSNQVLTVFINPALHSKVLTGSYNHYSLLRLNEELLGNRLIGHSADAHDMRSELGL